MGSVERKSDEMTRLEFKESPKPPYSVEQLLQVAARVYGFQISSHQQLHGFWDINVLVQVSEVLDNPHIPDVCPSGYIIKLVNSCESVTMNCLSGQMAVMQHLRDHDICTPTPVAQRDGIVVCYLSQPSLEEPILCSSAEYDKPYQSVTDKAEKANLFYCYEYIPGKILKSVPYTPHVMYQSGVFLANITNALKDFEHRGFDGRDTIWDLRRAGTELLPYTSVIKDISDRDMAEHVMRTMQSQVLDKLDGFRRGIVHGDFHEGNMLVSASIRTEGEYDPSAIIDFGENHEDYVVLDLGLWLAYVIMHCEHIPYLEAAGHVIAGYLSRCELTAAERGVLRTAAAARMVQSMTLSAYEYKLQSGGNQYLLDTAGCWPRLREYWTLSEAKVTETWNSIIAEYGLPNL